MKKAFSYGHRKFYEIPSSLQSSSNKFDDAFSQNASSTDKSELLNFIFHDVIGKETNFIGSYGRRKVVYCDYIASGRALHSIERYLTNNVMPIYGNTHTTTTVTSLQSSMFMNESR